MKEQITIPTTKIQRAAKFVKTGAKVGGNYIKHYTKKMIDPKLSKDQLDQDNAEDIYGSLSELKGSALKVAQMLAMDKNLLPQAYQNQFAMAQYSAPPLSYPLVVKTFREYFKKGPNELFDSFSKNAVNAASIGQVHQANLNGHKYAVKIQYPGVGNSVKSDLKLVKPFALRLFNLSEKELAQYLEEVESKLLEETDYELELIRSTEITKACSHLENLVFPNYYPDFSCERIITMDWIDGKHLKEFLLDNPSEDVKTKIGQALWDFYDHQVHQLKQVHADPHPGNFLLKPDGKLGVIDFGCVKVIPEDFYEGYFKLIKKDIAQDEEELSKAFLDLGIVFDTDTEEERKFFIDAFKEMISLLGRPFHSDSFDFSDDSYFKEIFDFSEKLSNMKELRESKQARGSRHALYINRTYFGLYNLLNDLKVQVDTTKPDWLR